MEYSAAREGQLGCPAGPDVIQLIQAREQVFCKATKTSEELKVIHGSTPWVLLRSGANIKTSKDDKVGSHARAQNNAFCGALTSNFRASTDLDAYKKATGGAAGWSDWVAAGTVDKDLVGSIGNSRALMGPNYRRSSTTGWRPIPGITSVDINVKDQWGAILEATVNLKIADRETLEEIDALYFKPGMVALLEIGHTIAVDKSGKVVYASSADTLPNEIFYTRRYFSDLADHVRKLRLKNRNYEALCGYITNFSWKIEKDGTYDCSIKLLSEGVVIKGLQLRQSSDFFDKDDDDEQKDKQQLLGTSVMLQALQDWTNDADAARQTAGILGILGPGVGDIAAVAIYGQGDYARGMSGDRGVGGVSTTSNGSQTTTLVQGAGVHPGETISWKDQPTNAKILDILTACIEKAKPTPTFKSSFMPIPVVVDKCKIHGFWGRLFLSDNDTYLHYITLRDALYILQYLNVNRDSTGSDLCYFNLNANYNYVDAPFCFSLNPSIAVKAQQLIDKSREPAFSEWSNDDYKYNVKALSRQALTYKVNPTIYDSDPSNPSRILNIWITMEELATCVKGVVESNSESYTVYDIVQTLLADIQKAFGNINNFRLHRNHQLEVWEIVDWNHIDKATLEESKIRISGTENTVTGFNIHSDVSDDLVNQMSIAAQSPKGKDNNSSTQELVHWNENSVSRFIPGASPSEQKNSQVAGNTDEDSERKEKEKAEKKFWDICEKLYRAVNWDGDNISDYDGEDAEERLSAVFTEIQAHGERFLQNQVNIAYEKAQDGGEGQGNIQNGIIPYKAELTMKGLGGLTIGTVFKMDEQLLPTKYKNWGNIITGISHKIDPNGWFTTIKTCYYPMVNSSVGSDSYGIKKAETSDDVWNYHYSSSADTEAVAYDENGNAITLSAVVPGGKVRIAEAAGTRAKAGARKGRGTSTAGDQGTEVVELDWGFAEKLGPGKFERIFRHSNYQIAVSASKLASKLAADSRVGYWQDRRGTLYTALVDKAGGSYEKFKQESGAVDTDCSAFCHTCYAAVDPRMRAGAGSLMRSGFTESFVNVKEGANTIIAEGANPKQVSSADRIWKTLTVGGNGDIKTVNDLRVGDVLWKRPVDSGRKDQNGDPIYEGHLAMVTGLPDKETPTPTRDQVLAEGEALAQKVMEGKATMQELQNWQKNHPEVNVTEKIAANSNKKQQNTSFDNQNWKM